MIGDARQHGQRASAVERPVQELPASGRYDPGDQAARHGADLPVRDWAARLVCSQCGSRAVDFAVAPLAAVDKVVDHRSKQRRQLGIADLTEVQLIRRHFCRQPSLCIEQRAADIGEEYGPVVGATGN